MLGTVALQIAKPPTTVQLRLNVIEALASNTTHAYLGLQVPMYAGPRSSRLHYL